MKAPYFFHKDKHHQGDVIVIELTQEVSFLNKASLKSTLDHLPHNSKVIIDASKTIYIDYDVLELIKEFQKINAPERNINFVLTGFKDTYRVHNSDQVHSDTIPLTNGAKGTAKDLLKELVAK